jgi:hypothetical protein
VRNGGRGARPEYRLGRRNDTDTSLVLYRPDGTCVRETEEARFYCMAHEYGHHLDVAMRRERKRLQRSIGNEPCLAPLR